MGFNKKSSVKAPLNPNQLVYWGSFLWLSYLALAPIWAFTYLPLLDLPEHVAQAVIWANPNTFTEGLPSRNGNTYTTQWLTPYLTVLLLCGTLTKAVGPIIAYKITLSLIILALPLSIQSLLKTIYKPQAPLKTSAKPNSEPSSKPSSESEPTWLALLGFPLSFGFALHLGFINFCLAVPLSLWTLSIILKAKNPNQTHTKNPIQHLLSLTLLFIALFFTHALAFALTLLFLLPILITSANRKMLAISVLPALLLTLAWIPSQTKKATDHGSFSLHPKNLKSQFKNSHPIQRLKDLPTWIQGANWKTLPQGNPTHLLLLTFSCVLLTHKKPKLPQKTEVKPKRYLPEALPTLLIPFILTLLLYLLLPKSLFNIIYIPERLPIYLTIFALSFLPQPKKPSPLHLLLLVLTLTLNLLHLHPNLSPQMKSLAKDSKHLETILHKIPPNSFIRTIRVQNSNKKTKPFYYWEGWVLTRAADTHLQFTTITHLPIQKTTKTPPTPQYILTNRKNIKNLGTLLHQSGEFKILEPPPHNKIKP